MLIYCAHKYTDDPAGNIRHASRTVSRLQISDQDNTYLSPLHAFSYLKPGKISYDAQMQLCEDLLMMCDMLLVIPPISKGVQREMLLAEKLHIPIKYLRKGKVCSR